MQSRAFGRWGNEKLRSRRGPGKAWQRRRSLVYSGNDITKRNQREKSAPFFSSAFSSLPLCLSHPSPRFFDSEAKPISKKGVKTKPKHMAKNRNGCFYVFSCYLARGLFKGINSLFFYTGKTDPEGKEK